MTDLHTIEESLRAIQEKIGTENEAKGFHDDRPERDAFVAGEKGDRAFVNATRHYHGNLHMLIVSEAVEAHDEIRHGRDATETYYDGAKPEGVPSEIADGIIRGFDYFHRAGIDGASIILEKLAYNTTRPFKHGKKF